MNQGLTGPFFMPTRGPRADYDGQEPGKGQDMPEANDTATQAATAEKTFTQEEMDAIIGERLGRLKAKYADYDELKSKAAAYDEAAEASKSELQKAVEERDRYKARLDKLEADAKRAELVAKVAAEQGVDAALLSRMSGDVEENAAFLKEQLDSQPRHYPVPDNGEAKAAAGKNTAQQFADAIDFL